MATEIKKLVDLPYNELITLGVIESTEDLREIFMDDVKLSFNVLRTLAKEDRLNEATKDVLREMFDKIILTQKTHIEKYLRLTESDKNPVDEIVPSVTPPVIPSTTEEKKLPRRYGKVSIMADIEKQGGKPTPLQNAMLKVNSLKNIYVNLSARGIKDQFGGTHLLSDADCRDIVAVVQIAERKLENILNRKK